MKAAIVTLPLHTNYGGLLQAYALKCLIQDLGHEVDVLDISQKTKVPSGLKAPLIYLKRFLTGKEIFRECRIRREYPVVSSCISRFTQDFISPRTIDSYTDIRMDDYDAFVVGSDQVWRPEYFFGVQDAFLRFTKDWDVRRVAYAASFGTEELEYDYTLLEECSALLSKFDAVSVREASGVNMCDEWFDYEGAVHVPDPVMMLPAQKYAESAGESCGKNSVVTYLLDKSSAKTKVAEFVSDVTGKPLHDVSVYPKDKNIPLEERVVPCMTSWLSAFINAEFVVTDSFHGCILSILFHKPFLVVGNKARGMARIESLLEMFSMENRLVDGIDPDDDGEGWLMEFDWNEVDAVLDKFRQKGLDFLRTSLNMDSSSDSGQVEM